jgi:hypothetical protein
MMKYMGWYKKALKQTPLIQDPEALLDDGTLLPYGNQPRPKDRLQRSLGLGTSKHNEGEISGEDSSIGSPDSQINSLTSGFTRQEMDDKGITDEGLGGEPIPRTEFQGGPSVSDPPSVMGMVPGDYSPSFFSGDNNPKSVAIQNTLRNIYRKNHNRKNIGDKVVNVIE